MNLEGFALDNITVDGKAMFRNPFRVARQSDEDIAAGLVVESMGQWVRGHGSGPYPLADGLQDHLIGLAIEEAARTDSTVTTRAEAWSDSAVTVLTNR